MTMKTNVLKDMEAARITKRYAKTIGKNARILEGLTAVDIAGERILLTGRKHGELVAELSRCSKALDARTPFERWLIRTGTSYGEFSAMAGISSRGLLHRYAIGNVVPSLDRQVQIEKATGGDVRLEDWATSAA